MGNTHAKGWQHSDALAHDEFQSSESPVDPPGSPLTYSPQLLMQPHEAAGSPYGSRGPGSAVSDCHAVAGWPAQPKLVPTVIVCASLFIWVSATSPSDAEAIKRQWREGGHGGNHVEVEGSFDNWTMRQPMQRSGKDFTIVKLLPPGVYQYKFIVDGEWKYAPDQTAMYDEQGNVNNVLEVQEYVPENLESLSSFDPPASPVSRRVACPWCWVGYNQALPTAEDYAKEPPPPPAHLQLTLLNVPPAMDAAASLPRPQHVILNHVYCQRATHQVNALVVGMTHRYKNKYVTTVVYKPRRVHADSDGAATGAAMTAQQQQQQQQMQQRW